MDLKNISKLSDNQLVELYRNPTTVKEIKTRILSEINERKLDEVKTTVVEGFDLKIKLLLIILSPIIIGSVLLLFIFHHYLLKNWNKKIIKNFGFL